MHGDMQVVNKSVKLPPEDEELIKSGYHLSISELQDHQEVRPAVLLISADTAILMPVSSWKNQEDKDEFKKMVWVASIAYNAHRSIFSSEAWVISPRTREEYAHQEAWFEAHGSFQDYPGRKEVVLVQVENEEGLSMGSWEIVREEGRSPSLLSFDEGIMTRSTNDERGISGPFANWLAPKEVRGDQFKRLLALKFMEASGFAGLDVTDKVKAWRKNLH